MTNIIFGRNDHQNVFRKAELFLLWCALTGTYANIRAFIVRHLVGVDKTTHDNVIVVVGTITAIAQALGRSGKFGTIEPHFLGKTLTLLP